MLNLSSILLFSENPQELSEFYEKIIGKKADMDDHDWHGWLVGNCFLSIGPHSEVKGKAKEPTRMIFNFESEDVKAESDRIKELGAEVVKEAYQPDEAQDMWIATFADPDGNYFQIVTPWKAK